MKKETIDVVNKFINELFEARSNEQYSGDYTITLSAEGHELVLAMNDINVDCIDEDELLIHLNVINQEE